MAKPEKIELGPEEELAIETAEMQPKEETPEDSTAATEEKDEPTEEEKPKVAEEKVEKPAEETPKKAPKKAPKPDVEELLKQLDVAKREVQEFKEKVAKANKKKEIAFRKKSEYSKQIMDKLNEMSGSKTERNSITNDVKDLKRQRDALNTQIRDRVKDIKKLNEEHKDVLEQFDRKNNPEALARQIEELEYKLETQPMGFEAEQKINKKVKELKKKYTDIKDKAAVFAIIREKSKEIDNLKRDANKFHRQVQEKARESQEKHEALMSESGELTDIRKCEDDLYKAFLKEKDTYLEINQKLKEKIAELQRIKQSLNDQNVKLKEDQKHEEMKTLKERAKEAEEKVRKKGKLTTEDLLAMQGMKK